jgi:monoamine oxidase
LPLLDAFNADLLDHPVSAEDFRYLRFKLASEIEAEFGCSLADFSTKYGDEGAELKGNDVMLVDGYDGVTRALATNLTILRSLPVRRVQTGAKSVQVTTSRGVFKSRHCICTVSLGVLKAGSIAFEPGLPSAKREAIAQLAMGTLHKAWLSFDTAFWQDARVLSVVSETSNQLPFTVVATDIMRGKPTLLALHGGDEGAHLERLDNAALRAELVTRLRSVWPSAPLPSVVRSSSWGAHPYTLGSYSYLPVGASPRDREALAESVGDRVHFAGEATHVDSPAMVHGAYLSGLRAAKQALR